MTALVMMGILLFGVVGYRTLPVSDLPNIDFPTLQVESDKYVSVRAPVSKYLLTIIRDPTYDTS